MQWHALNAREHVCERTYRIRMELTRPDPNLEIINRIRIRPSRKLDLTFKENPNPTLKKNHYTSWTYSINFNKIRFQYRISVIVLLISTCVCLDQTKNPNPINITRIRSEALIQTETENQISLTYTALNDNMNG